MDSPHTPWHVAFYQAIQAELIGSLDFLDFAYEYQLTSEPLRIDTLVIVKSPAARIEKNIGRIFKRINICEYKGPGDNLTIKDFYRVYGYGLLYAARTGGVEMEDITLTFVGSAYPRKLIKYLKEVRGYPVEEVEAGIYQVTGDWVSIQFIVTKRLREGENRWLRELREGLEAGEVWDILEGKRQVGNRTALGAYYDVVLRANPKAFLEAMRMADSTLTLEDVLTETGFIPKWLEQGREQGLEQGREQGLEQGKTEAARRAAKNLLKKGLSVDEIAEAVELDIATVQSLAGSC